MSRRAELSSDVRAAFVLVTVVGLAVAACGALSGGQGDPSAPVLITGRVLDARGIPVGGATLQLEVFDDTNAQVGVRIATVFEASYTAAIDGTFSIHLAPPPELVAFSTKNNGYVNFQVIAIAPDRSLISPFAFPRQLQAGVWADEIPVVELRSLGGS